MTRLECAHDHRPLAGHDHADESGHVHRPLQQRRLAIALVLTIAMMVVEVVGGVLTGSLALLSDAAHMLSHALAIGVSFVAIRIAQRVVDRHEFPFGLFRVEVLAAAVNGATLVVFAAFITWEAAERLFTPVPVAGMEMTVIAAVGLIVNLVTAWVLHAAAHEDINTRSAFFHLLADTASSVVVVGGGVVVVMTGWMQIDPILSVAIACFVLRWAWMLLRDAGEILLERTPDGIDLTMLIVLLRQSSTDILDVHDLHVWKITDGFLCMTGHLVVSGELSLTRADLVRSQAARLLRERFGIAHATIQLEPRR